MKPILDGQPRVDGKLFNARAAERRALFREAYMAALSGMSADITPIEKDAAKYGYSPDDIIVRRCHDRAMRVVSQWDGFMEELEKEIGG